MEKLLKNKYHDSALEFISDSNQTNFKLGVMLSELKSNGGEQYANAIKDLTINEIVDAVISQNFDKWVESSLLLVNIIKDEHEDS